MLSKEFQKRVLDAHKEGKTVKHRCYEYGIQYNPVSDIHTWIIRKKGNSADWIFIQPVSREVR